MGKYLDLMIWSTFEAAKLLYFYIVFFLLVISLSIFFFFFLNECIPKTEECSEMKPDFKQMVMRRVVGIKY